MSADRQSSVAKIGDRVELFDGFTREVGKLYGIERGRFGTQYRIKVERDGDVEFRWVSQIRSRGERTENGSPIGVFRIDG